MLATVKTSLMSLSGGWIRDVFFFNLSLIIYDLCVSLWIFDIFCQVKDTLSFLCYRLLIIAWWVFRRFFYRFLRKLYTWIQQSDHAMEANSTRCDSLKGKSKLWFNKRLCISSALLEIYNTWITIQITQHTTKLRSIAADKKVCIYADWSIDHCGSPRLCWPIDRFLCFCVLCEMWSTDSLQGSENHRPDLFWWRVDRLRNFWRSTSCWTFGASSI